MWVRAVKATYDALFFQNIIGIYKTRGKRKHGRHSVGLGL
jgi:hypothetical protein